MLCSALAGVYASDAPAAHWVAAWGAVPDDAGPPIKAQTVRQIVRMSIGGNRLRLRLSNLDGDGPLTIGPVHIASHATGSAIRAGSDHALSFRGKPTVTIAKGDSVQSDPLSMPIAPLQELAVSMYLPAANGASTVHSDAQATAYITEQGDATAALDLPHSETASNRFFLIDVDIAAVPSARAWVAFGDSITDGYQSTADANRRWPDDLASRLQADRALASVALVNAGISGNRILHDGAGPSALSRFDRDALQKAGVRGVLLLEGINDIGQAGMAKTAAEDVSAQQVIDGIKTLIARAHAKNLKIYGATLTPFGGAEWPYHTAAGEVKRQVVNTWIRTAGAFDAVVDFDRVTRDPARPDHFLPAYDSGDHLHPNDTGYQAMADSIDLHLFASPP